MANVLVTGGTGFIGRHLVKALLRQGDKVTALVRKTSNITGLAKNNVRLAAGDIGNIASLKDALNGIDITYHCAGHVRNDSLKKLRKINVEGTGNVCRAALEKGITRLVYTSSIAVITGNRQLPLTEDMPYSATNDYGQSKLEAEKVVIEYRKKGLRAAILRPCMVYGPGEPHALELLINLIRWRLIPIIGPGTARWHLVNVDNVASALLLAAEKDRALTGTYIIADREILSVAEILNLIARAIGVKTPWHIHKGFIPVLSRTPFIKNKVKFFLKDRVYDISRAVKELGYNPLIDTYQGLQETAGHYLEKHKNS